MYMIGLLPFGLQKLFVLWLYAKEMQGKAAKIATYSLVTYVLIALSLISPMGVSGLALASTSGGVVSFILTIRVFGLSNFMDIIRSKNAIYLLVGATLLTFMLLAFKEFLASYYLF